MNLGKVRVKLKIEFASNIFISKIFFIIDFYKNDLIYA